MRTAKRLAQLAIVTAIVAAAPAFAFDGTKSADQPTPMEAFRSGAQALKTGETAKAVVSLEYAAENGHAMAQWKLGRMYAEGEGVTRDDLRAFHYFRRIANSHADDSPGTPQARFVANAFVALGHYYLEGIPKTEVKRDPIRAREMFAYAASYFRDAEAQYNLGRLYLDGVGVPQDAKQAARWLHAAAQKGHAPAQAVLGTMLFTGEGVPRQAAYGLMWLTLARENASTNQPWIAKQYDSAVKQATENEKALGGIYLQQWLSTPRRD
jgi:TPR repeat protein